MPSRNSALKASDRTKVVPKSTGSRSSLNINSLTGRLLRRPSRVETAEGIVGSDEATIGPNPSDGPFSHLVMVNGC
jgi:hypothetical protein